MLYLISNSNTAVTMFNNNYGNIVLFITSVFLGVYSVLFLAEHFKILNF